MRVAASRRRSRRTDLRALRALVDRMDRAVARDDIDAYHAANLEFHDTLVALAGNRKLLATYRRLVNELHLYRRATLAQAGTLPVSVREHHDILDKIAADDAAGAGARCTTTRCAAASACTSRASDARHAAPSPMRRRRKR